MNQIRVVKEDNYTVVDNYFIRDDTLSWKAKGLLVYLLHLPNDWVVNMTDLKKRSKDGSDSTTSGIKELIDKGYVGRVQIKSPVGRFQGYEYTVREKPYHGNPLTVNPTLLSTKELSTKELSTKDTIVQSKELNIPFEEFWDLYNKKQGRKKCIAKWKRLSDKDRENAMRFIPKYKKLVVDTYRQHPLTFLNSETWNDELTTKNNSKPMDNRPKSRVVIGFERGKPIYED